MEIKFKDKNKQFKDAESIAEVLRKILVTENIVDRDKEHLWCIGLDGANRIKYIELVTLGIADQSLVHPREVFRLAIMKGISKLIVAHNHPSNMIDPSKCDERITKTLKASGDILGIELLDHVIITDNEYYSFREHLLFN